MDSKKSESDENRQPRPSRLTERQRAEARRRRRQGYRPRSATRVKTGAGGNVLSRGARATGSEIKRTSLFLGRSILSALDQLRPAGGFVIVGLLAVAGFFVSVFRLIARGAGATLAAAGRLFLAADRLITPNRAIGFVTLVAAGLLIASQFIVFRAVEIGQPGYVAVETITHAPRVEELTPVDSHWFLILIVALIAFGAGLSALLTRRRLPGIVIAAVGVLTIVIALAVDLPKALDTAEATLQFSGARAVLLSGFWLELGAGVVLTVTGLVTLLAPGEARARVARRQRNRRSHRRAPVGSQA